MSRMDDLFGPPIGAGEFLTGFTNTAGDGGEVNTDPVAVFPGFVRGWDGIHSIRWYEIYPTREIRDSAIGASQRQSWRTPSF